MLLVTSRLILPLLAVGVIASACTATPDGGPGPTGSPTSATGSTDTSVPPGGYPTLEQVLSRPNVTARTGEASGQFRVMAEPNETFDLRGYVVRFWPPETDPDLYPIAIGKDDPADGTAVVGGAVVGALPRDATWQEVKECCDSDALRIEGTGWMASFGFYAENVEDGFAPRVLEGTEQDNTVRFLLEGCHMTYIRDDAIENDNLMSGMIRDCLFDGVNRFLSERPTSGTGYSNTGSVVEIEDVLVRMEPMPNLESPDGIGHGSVFKWDETAGSVIMRDSIVYLDEPSHSSSESDAFPPGEYENVTVVLGPGFDGDYPVPLPEGVTVTRDVQVWEQAKQDWLDRHGGGLSPD